MKAKKMIYGSVILLFVIILGLIMPMLGRVSPGVIRKMRITNLQRWHERVCLYINEKGKLPESLYDVYYYFNVQYSSMLANPENNNKISSEKYHNDPNIFNAGIDYAFEKKDNGWVIKESKIYKDEMYLYIDSLGVINEHGALATE